MNRVAAGLTASVLPKNVLEGQRRLLVLARPIEAAEVVDAADRIVQLFQPVSSPKLAVHWSLNLIHCLAAAEGLGMAVDEDSSYASRRSLPGAITLS